ncbi:MAG: tyrosine-protein kinase [Solirubrobacterales bacterium]|jgi:non-specific protein-tyrosine kinase|nr:tyrosine-protein kinase [Solirubrobacterales bacterium]
MDSTNGSGDRSRAAVSGADWMQPPVEQEGLKRYVATLRERIWIVIATIVITTGIAILYVMTATEVYRGATEMSVNPAPADQSGVVAQLPLLRESADPTRDVETAARYVTNIDVAERVREELDSPLSAEALLGKITAEPVAQSEIIVVRADATTPEEAAELSNAFAEQAIVEQTEELHSFIEDILPGLEKEQENLGETQAGTQLFSDISTLRSYLNGDDPTMSVLTEATPPSAPISPKPVLSVIGGLFAGTILGIAAAFAVQVLDPRLRREEQLRRLYRLPILARIPKEVKKTEAPIDPLSLSPAASEAYRTLRGTLAVQKRNHGDSARVILVTGSSPSEGKTTTAVNLATSLAAAGNSVILMESDLRRPSIGRALGVTPTYGMVSVLIESIDLEDALVTTEQFGANFGLLLADYEGGWISELFALPAARQLIEDAREIADYVIVDSPPLTDVVDALPLASYVDDVLLVVKLGKTTLSKLAQLGELLAENGIKPAGFTVVGTPRPTRSDYHYYGARPGGMRDRLPIGSSKS